MLSRGAARVAALPAGVGWREVLVVGVVAGIGFTMAIFIADLAFPADPRLEAAKLGVLAASATAALLGLAAGRALLAPARGSDGAATDTGAESSTAT